MKKVLMICFTVLLTVSCYSQDDSWQWYYYFKAGVRHNLSVYQNVDSKTEKIVKFPGGIERMVAVSAKDVEINPKSNMSLKAYAPSFPVGFYVTSPVFLTTGIEYQPVVFRNVYRAKAIDENGYYYFLDEMNTMQSLSFPLFIDTRPLYQKLVVYAGVRLHVNIQNWQLQKVSWGDHSKLRKVNFDSDEFLTTSVSYAIGFCYSFLSLEFTMLPSTFFNIEYKDDFGNQPYSYLANESIKSLTLSFMIGKLRKR